MSRRGKLLATALVLGVVGVVGGQATMSAFVARNTNAGNTFASGTVKLEDNDNDTALLSLSAALPGATDSGCIKVTYSGSLGSGVRLYGTTTGTGLDQYLDLKVTRGTYSPTDPGFDFCTNFQPDGTNYIGAGNGVVYNGTLQGYADSYASGLVDPLPASPETWTTGEAHVYKVEVTLQGNPAAQGLGTSQAFTWEARNL
jgi:hypothetical protein